MKMIIGLFLLITAGLWILCPAMGKVALVVTGMLSFFIWIFSLTFPPPKREAAVTKEMEELHYSSSGREILDVLFQMNATLRCRYPSGYLSDEVLRGAIHASFAGVLTTYELEGCLPVVNEAFVYDIGKRTVNFRMDSAKILLFHIIPGGDRPPHKRRNRHIFTGGASDYNLSMLK